MLQSYAYYYQTPLREEGKILESKANNIPVPSGTFKRKSFTLRFMSPKKQFWSPVSRKSVLTNVSTAKVASLVAAEGLIPAFGAKDVQSVMHGEPIVVPPIIPEEWWQWVPCWSWHIGRGFWTKVREFEGSAQWCLGITLWCTLMAGSI